jgi:hypothetical protein
MDNLFLEEFIDKVDPNTIKEIQIYNKSNIFQNNNDILESMDDYDINTNTIIHKQENVSENNNKDKIYDISKLYTKEITTERLLISYEDMIDTELRTFNGSYECEFNLNKQYKNVIGFRLDKAIYEYSAVTDESSVYFDIIVNNIPREACINNLKGYNIIKRLPYDFTYHSTNKGVTYTSLYSKPNYFYPINLNKLNLELRNNNGVIDLSLLLFTNINGIDKNNIGKFSFEFELTLLNR